MAQEEAIKMFFDKLDSMLKNDDTIDVNSVEDLFNKVNKKLEEQQWTTNRN